MNLRIKTLLASSLAIVALVAGLSVGLSYLILNQIVETEKGTMENRLVTLFQSVFDEGTSEPQPGEPSRGGAQRPPFAAGPSDTPPQLAEGEPPAAPEAVGGSMRPSRGEGPPPGEGPPAGEPEQPSFVLVLDANGRPVTKEDGDTGVGLRVAEPPAPLREVLAKLPVRWAPIPLSNTIMRKSGTQVGFLHTPEGLLALTKQEIGAGQHRVTRITGRWIDAPGFIRLGHRAHIDAKLLPLNSHQIPPGLLGPAVTTGKIARVAPPERRSEIRLPPEMKDAGSDLQILESFLRLNDVRGNAVAIVQALSPNPFYQKGKQGVRELLSFIWIAGLVFGVAFNVVLDRWVLARVSRLSGQVKQVQGEYGAGSSIELPGTDELSGLATDVNMMLRRLEEWRELEEKNREMTALNNELQRLNELKDEFLANTSHELRTPLNGMIGIAQSMLDGATGPLSTEQHYNMQLITQSGKRLTSLVNDILDFSKLRHHELSLRLKPVSLRQIVELTLRLDRMMLGKKDLSLANAVPEDLPPVHADEDRLQQILHNLIGNAIKFTPAGSVKVTASVLESSDEEAARREIAVSVEDTGIGIPEEKLDRVFESFEQVEGSSSREYGGTGLGLAITRSLVELHGGRIWAESKDGEGSVFTFTLPVSADAMRDSGPCLTLSERASGIPISEPRELGEPAHLATPQVVRAENSLSPHVLIVDDEPVNLQVVKNFLQLEDYRLTLASDGHEALALLEKGLSPDIVLLDVMMPKMTGYEVVQAIRQKVLNECLPIILLSARNQTEDIVLGLEVGANDYLTKPISKEELVARIQTHLQIRLAIESRQKIESELAIAAQIQRSMVPDIATCEPMPRGYRLAGYFQPARMVGGDLYDVFLLRENKLCVVIGDVADKGVPAALLMARTVTLIRILSTPAISPVELLTAVNRELCKNNPECLFVTLFCGILNLDTGEVEYASAGHDPPVLAGQNEVRFLDLETGPPVGIDEDAEFPSHRSKLTRGDVVLLYTDGVTEAMSPDGELFTDKRMAEALMGATPMTPEAATNAVKNALTGFVEDGQQSDDVTVLALGFGECSGCPEAETRGRCSLVVDSELSELPKVKHCLSAFLTANSLPQETIEDAQLIVEEVLVNIMQYGYSDRRERPIDLEIALDPSLVRMVFQDQGVPFNPLTEIPAPDLEKSEEERASGGFGFHLVRELSGRLEYRYEDSMNVLTVLLPI